MQIYTEREQRALKRRDALEVQYHNLTDALIEIECNDEISEHTFKTIETLVERRKNEIEQELLMLPKNHESDIE